MCVAGACVLLVESFGFSAATLRNGDGEGRGAGVFPPTMSLRLPRGNDSQHLLLLLTPLCGAYTLLPISTMLSQSKLLLSILSPLSER
jgi:hypothetical protein